MTDAYPRWLLVQSVLGMFLLSLLAVMTSPSLAVVLLTGMAALSFGSLLIAAGGLRTLADAVTFARVALVLGWLVLGAGNWASAAALALILSLDLVDGWLARRRGGTAEGAVYDMEADQLSVLVLSYVAYARGLPVWILLLPGLKYGNVLLSNLLKLPLGDPKPKAGDNRRGRIICAVLLVALWTAVLPVAPIPLRTALAGAALILLAFSFGDDLVYLVRHRVARVTG